MNSRKTASLLSIALAMPLLTGATLEQWRQRPPRWEATSTRSFDEPRDCLSEKWVATLSMKMTTMPKVRGLAYVNDGDNRDILVDVTDEGTHRSIKLWLRTYMGLTVGAKEQIAKLQSCVARDMPPL
jgi:hypothetical protein